MPEAPDYFARRHHSLLIHSIVTQNLQLFADQLGFTQAFVPKDALGALFCISGHRGFNPLTILTAPDGEGDRLVGAAFERNQRKVSGLDFTTRVFEFERETCVVSR